MLRLVLGAVLCGTLCSCGGGPSGSLKIRERTREPSRLDLSATGEDKRWVTVRTEGADTIIDFRGREFVFQGLTGYVGTLEPDEVDLEIGDAEVLITTVEVEVEQAKARARMEYAHLPPGKRIVYRGGSIWAE